MASKINQPVVINGEKKWIRANTMQEFTDKVIKLMAAPPVSSRHPFDAYAWNWYDTYSKPNVETATAATYKRQLTLHILPAFAGLAVEDITTDEVQRLFNCQRRCDFVIFRRAGNVRKWRVKVCNL